MNHFASMLGSACRVLFYRREVRTREHIVEGMLRALEMIDAVIELFRSRCNLFCLYVALFFSETWLFFFVGHHDL